MKFDKINCKNCKSIFQKSYPNHIFCSINCQEEYYRKIKTYPPCILCGWNLITDTHHIEWQTFGGGHKEKNLVYVCPNHHRMLHNEKFRKDMEEIIILIKEKHLKDKHQELNLNEDNGESKQ